MSTKREKKQYRYLRKDDLVRFGDERWDYEFGWTRCEDRNMERFSKEYRRVGAKPARRWRRRTN